MNERRDELVTAQPCPACGCKPVTMKAHNGYYVHCEDCGVSGPSRRTDTRAIDVWNRLRLAGDE